MRYTKVPNKPNYNQWIEVFNKAYMDWYYAWQAYEQGGGMYEDVLPANTFGELVIKRLEANNWM